MGWRDFESRDRWSLFISAGQALATFGMFMVTLIGIWKVAPIITYQTYQIEQQQEAAKDRKLAKYSPTTDRFVNDVLGWWTNQVESYQRILDMIQEKDKRQLKISFKIDESRANTDDPTGPPDFLIVTATNAKGKEEVVKVPVNERAMNPNQYIQCKINQGMLYDLEPTKRHRAEIAIAQYIQAGVVSKVPPAYVRSDMSLQQLFEEISFHQNKRTEVITQIRALQGVIDAAMEQ